MNTFDRIAKILTTQFGIAHELGPADTFLTLDLDSLDQVDFAVEVEMEFDVDLLDDPIFSTVATIGELVFAIEKHKALRAA